MQNVDGRFRFPMDLAQRQVDTGAEAGIRVLMCDYKPKISPHMCAYACNTAHFGAEKPHRRVACPTRPTVGNTTVCLLVDSLTSKQSWAHYLASQKRTRKQIVTRSRRILEPKFRTATRRVPPRGKELASYRILAKLTTTRRRKRGRAAPQTRKRTRKHIVARSRAPGCAKGVHHLQLVSPSR